MFLKRIEIKGFKSFADKTDIEFPNSMTAIIGPNGSGKSNIAEAVRWVLGEQSAKSLRGQKMEDVIFSGSDSRQAINYAQVSLILDNENQLLPLDISEVSVSRKVYRSGDSEYSINNQVCRLRDINELFMDTGLGKEAYSIIGQGRIDEVLSNRSEERRGIFEEAAGITKYRTRKREAEKRLTETETNLVRVYDIMNELEEQIEPLSKAATAAKAWLEYKQKLINLDIGLLAWQIDKADKEWKQASADQQLSNLDLEKILVELNSEQAEQTKLRWQLEQYDQLLNKEQDTLMQLNIELTKTIGERNILLEKQQNNLSIIEKYKGEIDYLEQTIEKRKLNYEMLIAEIENYIHTIDEKKEILNKKNIELLTSNEVLSNTNVELEQTQIQLNDIIQNINNQTTNNKYLLEKQEQLNIEIAKDFNQHNSIKEELLINEDGLLKKEKENNDINNEIQLLTTEYQQKKLECDQLSSELNNAEKRNNEYNNNLTNYKNRIYMLEELESDYAGYHQGVKEIMKASKNNNSFSSGIHGTVAELVTVEEKYSLAIETALANAIHHVVVNNSLVAENCINFLKQNKKGRATFLPLDIIKGYTRNYDELKNSPGYIGLAPKLVKFDLKYQQIFDSILGNTIITVDIQTANTMAKKINYKARFVTLDGDYINPGGSITGGSNYQKSSNILSRKNEIKSLYDSVNKLKENIKTFITYKKELEQKFEYKNTELQKTRDALQEYKDNLVQLNSEIREQRQLLEWQKQNLSSKEQTIQQKQATIAEIVQNISDIEKEIELLNKQKSILTNNINKHKNITNNQKLINNNDKESIVKIQMELVKYEEQLENAKKSKIVIEDEIKQLDFRLMEIKASINESQSSIENHQLNTNSINEKIDEQKNYCNIAQNKVDEQKINKKITQDKLTEIDNKIQKIQSSIKSIEKAINQCEVKCNRCEVELNSALSQLQEDYEITYEKALVKFPLTENPSTVKSKVKQIKKDMEALGDVNIGAIEEHSRVSERFNFLQEQRQDLLDAMEKISLVIRDMNREMEKRFLENFTLIKENFKEVFSKLFGGGRAKLELSDPSQILSTGIEIYAEPPGKKLQHLSLLSGGERALTAISILFAILKVSPVPFCVLDEVDAALDETNVSRFSKYLREYANETQFIVITHRKGTMENADILYGVTMEGSGVSRMISVKLEDIDDELLGNDE